MISRSAIDEYVARERRAAGKRLVGWPGRVRWAPPQKAVVRPGRASDKKLRRVHTECNMIPLPIVPAGDLDENL
jgi:hypothetical protein